MIKFLLLVTFVSISLQEDGPVWPDKFYQEFTEDTSYFFIKGHTQGKFYYDYQTRRYRIDREDGKYDRYCGTVYKLRSTPCSHIVVDGVRYLYFPEKNDCCSCCTNKGGCGVLKPDWMKTGKKVEEYEKDGQTYQVWNQRGLQDNLLTVVKKGDSWVMTSLDQKPNDLMTFNPDSETSDFDESVLELPDLCKTAQKCTKLSVCGALDTEEI
jgi:hypothetical protein